MKSFFFETNGGKKTEMFQYACHRAISERRLCQQLKSCMVDNLIPLIPEMWPSLNLFSI